MNELLTGNLLVASSLANDPVYAGGVCLIVHHDESNVIGVMLNRPMKPTAQALLEMLDKGESSDIGKNRLAQFNEAQREDAEFDPIEYDEEEFGDPEFDSQEFDEAEFGQPEFDESPLDDSRSDEIPIEEPTEQQLPSTVAGEGSPFGMLHFGGPRSGPVVAIHQTSQYAEAETGDGIYVAAQKQHLEDLVRGQPAPYRLIVGHLGWEVDELAAEIDAGLWHMVPATTDAVFSAASDMWPRLIRRATSNSVARWMGIPDVVAAGDLN